MLFSNLRKRHQMRREDADAIIEKAKTEAPLDLEKGDIPAMILAALIVFLPFILAISGVMYLLWWVIFNVWGG